MGYATVFVTPHTGKKTSQLYNLFRARSLGNIENGYIIMAAHFFQTSFFHYDQQLRPLEIGSIDLSAKAGVVKVTYQTGECVRVGINTLKQIIIYGETLISSSLLRLSYEHNISVVLMPARGKKGFTSVLMASKRNFALREKQYRCYFNQSIKHQIAQNIIYAKLVSQYNALSDCGIDMSDFKSKYFEHCHQCTTISELMGVRRCCKRLLF